VTRRPDLPPTRMRRPIAVTGVLTAQLHVAAWKRDALLLLVVRVLAEMDRNGPQTSAA
jgi:hypothetical protein